MADDDDDNKPPEDPKVKLVWLNEERNRRRQDRREREAKAPTDADLAQMFVERHEAELRHVVKPARWFFWDTARWQPEATGLALDLARELCKQAAADFEMRNLASLRAIKATETLAGVSRPLSVTMTFWDRDPWLLNTRGGTVELKTGTLRPHRRDDFCTKVTAVTPNGDCPLWRKVLAQIFKGDAEMISFFQRLVGYSLTGDCSEEKFFFLWGRGGNGKSLVVNALRSILGDYAMAAPSETFIASRNDRHPTELAGLKGRRLVVASEIDEGREWNEARLKAVTGRDQISARFMRGDFFEFTPEFKLWIVGNHKPSLRRVTPAWRRRLILIPFLLDIAPEDQDHELPDKLREEWPGILQWAIEGAIDWQERGLRVPSAVIAATGEYLEAQDALTQWLEDCCTTADPDSFTSSRTLFASWQGWAKEAGERAGNEKALVQALKEAGYKSTRKTRTGPRGFERLAVTMLQNLRNE